MIIEALAPEIVSFRHMAQLFRITEDRRDGVFEQEEKFFAEAVARLRYVVFEQSEQNEYEVANWPQNIEA